MPELPEVEAVGAALRESLLGLRLDAIHVLWAGALKPSPKAVRDAVVGKRLVAVTRHGKYLFLDFAPRRGARPTHQLLLHLRMTGQVFVDPDYTPDRQLRLRFDFEGRPVYFRDQRKFGGFELLDGVPGREAIPHVGEDMLKIRFAAWLPRMAGRRAPVKGLLLDQGIAAGIGNIYADEALHRAGVHPAAPPAALSEERLRSVFDESKRVLRLGVRHGGTTFLTFRNFSGRPGNFRSKLRVFGRQGEPCPVCAEIVQKTRVAGRGTHFCPRCQPADAS